jgi:hypothetical protein
MSSPDGLPRQEDRLAGTLLGTALGVALGLPAEGMSASAIARRFGRLDRFRLLGRTGYVSDDTEQSALVAQSLACSPKLLDAAVLRFGRALLGWLRGKALGRKLLREVATIVSPDTIFGVASKADRAEMDVCAKGTRESSDVEGDCSVGHPHGGRDSSLT